MLVADGLKHKKGNLISSPNPRINTQYPGFWIAWNVDRTHLVHRDSISSPSSFLPFFLFFYFLFIFLYLNDSRRLAQGTFKMKRFNGDVMYVVRVDVLCMCYVSEYVRVIIILMGGRPVSLVRHYFPVTFSTFFSFSHFVPFGLLSFSIVICDRISTCIIQYSYINRATPTGLRLERPSTLFSIFLSFFYTSASEFALRFPLRGCRNRVAYMCISCLCICVTSVFKYISLFFLFFFSYL